MANWALGKFLTRQQPAVDWAIVPATTREIDAVVRYCRRLVSVRLTTQQAAKFVPIAGQAVSAALTYSSLRYVCELHIQQCVAISRELMLPAPTTADESR